MYRTIWRDGHSVREHRIIMENVLGRPLRQGEVVHHIDGDPSNNKIENLIVMSRAGHSRYTGHIRKYEYDKHIRKLLELDGQEWRDELKRLTRWL